MKAKGRERAQCLVEGAEVSLQAWLREAGRSLEQKPMGVFILHWAPAFSHSPLLQP